MKRVNFKCSYYFCLTNLFSQALLWNFGILLSYRSYEVSHNCIFETDHKCGVGAILQSVWNYDLNRLDP